ncbi:unnamed protein product [Penicillium nalgiovense]|nr:unnamed protein product [Penicillium nalgiovense]
MAFVVDDRTNMPAKMGLEKTPLPEIDPALVPPCSAADLTLGLCRGNQLHHADETTYARMFREEAQMDMCFSITVNAANWALLAGYLVIPGIFTSLQTSNQVERTLQTNEASRTVLHVIGIAALTWLMHFPKLRGNFPWLINKVFVPLPACCCRAVGHYHQCLYISRWDWSVMAIITTAVTGASLLSCAALLALYKLYKLERVRK